MSVQSFLLQNHSESISFHHCPILLSSFCQELSLLSAGSRYKGGGRGAGSLWNSLPESHLHLSVHIPTTTSPEPMSHAWNQLWDVQQEQHNEEVLKKQHNMSLWSLLP